MAEHIRDTEGFWMKIRNDLRLGYGVEDIALRHKFDPQDVRDEIEVLRMEGELKGIYRRAKL